MTKTTTISGFSTGPVLMLDGNNVVELKKGAHLMPGGDIASFNSSFLGTISENVMDPTSTFNNTYKIDGELLGYQVGVLAAGENDSIAVGATGSVYAPIAVASIGAHATITNDGKIVGSFADSVDAGGILAAGAGSKVVNNGFVSGVSGIIASGDKTEVVNGKHGVIYGDVAGVAVLQNMTSGDRVEFVNHGHLTGSGDIAFNATTSDANVTMVNDGTIKGVVAFGEGNDTLDNRGGSLNELSVVGGMGNDTLIVDDSKHFLLENAGEGNDTVKSTVSYTLSDNVENLFLLGKARINGTGTGTDDDNAIHGNAGTNKLTGLAGADDLYGGKGKDMLIGGGGTDTFHFATGDGHDTVKDFTHMEDTVDVSKWAGMDSLAHLKAHAVDGDDGVVITRGDDSLTLIGIHKADLANGDFHFAM